MDAAQDRRLDAVGQTSSVVHFRRHCMLFGVIKKKTKDTGPFSLGTIDVMGQEMDAEFISLYGTNASPPEGSRCLLFFSEGDSGKCFALPIDKPADRFDKHEEGEVRVGNTKTGTSTLLRKDGAKIDTVKGDHERTTDGAKKEKVTGNITQESGGDIVIKSDGVVHINP